MLHPIIFIHFPTILFPKSVITWNNIGLNFCLKKRKPFYSAHKLWKNRDKLFHESFYGNTADHVLEWERCSLQSHSDKN